MAAVVMAVLGALFVTVVCPVAPVVVAFVCSPLAALGRPVTPEEAVRRGMARRSELAVLDSMRRYGPPPGAGT
jgi:hypothetical protein